MNKDSTGKYISKPYHYDDYEFLKHADYGHWFGAYNNYSAYRGYGDTSFRLKVKRR